MPKHCTLEWNGGETSTSTVVLTNTVSENRTFVSTAATFAPTLISHMIQINSRPVCSEDGRRCQVLADGCEIAFGTLVGDRESRALNDYRGLSYIFHLLVLTYAATGFIFRHRACRTMGEGLDRFYDLLSVLGTGFSGTVMKALQREEGNWYAVKIIPASKLRKAITESSVNAVTTHTIPSALKQIFDTIQRLQHQNICEFKEFFYETQEISEPICGMPDG